MTDRDRAVTDEALYDAEKHLAYIRQAADEEYDEVPDWIEAAQAAVHVLIGDKVIKR